MNRTLSVVIPAYNEERYIGTVLERILAVDLTALGIATQVIVVDDHSADKTGEIASGFPGVLLHRLPDHGGKGAAVRAGIQIATGDYVILQDADLEYAPEDYASMIRVLLAHPGAAVYGSRYLQAGRRRGQSWLAYLGGRSLSMLASVCTGARLTDTATALKLFSREFVASLRLSTSGFEIDQEITMKILARGGRILEVPVAYTPRTRAEGKKIGPWDWLTGAWTLWRFRRG